MEPLSIEDLATLFGHLRQDEDGTLHVERDYEEEDEDDEDDDQDDGTEGSDDEA
jgi:hypothetical protein